MKTAKTSKKLKISTEAVPAVAGNGGAGACDWQPSISVCHYTIQGEHPEDRIYRDKEYIRRLQRHIDEVFDALEKDLRVKEGDNWLFDFIFNEEGDMEFEDYLRVHGTQYKDIVRVKGGGSRGNKGGTR
jgi:hypothetical protein